jgi:IS30 family transposase
MARGRRLGPEVRREAIRLASKGWTRAAIAAELRIAHGSVVNIVGPMGGVLRRAAQRQQSPARLSLDDRIEIKLGLERGDSLTALGRQLGRHTSTISREVQRNGGRVAYRPGAAHEQAEERARRPKPTKLATCPALRDRVVDGLERLWSPAQIARRLRAEFPDDAGMQISHETIYTSLFVQGRGELRRELAACLRTGRTQRRSRDRVERRGQLPDKVMISDRPAEATDRAVPGHWEGDLIIGKNNASAIGTLVERTTRFVLLLHLEGGRGGAVEVREAMTAAIQTLPAALWRTITWDQGKEMIQHQQFTIDTGIQIYFCDPHSPWQRGSNENTNGLLRQYLPKGSDLAARSQVELDQIAAELNGRPRQTLGWMTPAEKMQELLR